MSYPPANTPYATYSEYLNLSHADFRAILSSNPNDPRIHSTTVRWITLDNVKRLWPIANTIEYAKTRGCVAIVTVLKNGVISIIPTNKDMPDDLLY